MEAPDIKDIFIKWNKINRIYLCWQVLTYQIYYILTYVNMEKCNMNTDIGGKKPYHFGNLKEALIEQGIALIHEEGIEKFSLRKAAKK